MTNNWKEINYLGKYFATAQITTAQVAFSGAHFRFTTAQIVINGTLK